MFGLFRKKSSEIYTPVNGEVVELKKVNDPVFNEKMMGEGFAVKPIDGKIHSPIRNNQISFSVFACINNRSRGWAGSLNSYRTGYGGIEW